MRVAGFAGTLGLEEVLWQEGCAELRLPLEPRHLNRSGFLHGGILMTMLDVACARAGTWVPEGEPARYVATLSMATNFLRGVKSGVLRATGLREPGGNTIYSATARVFDERGALLAIGQGTYRYRSRSAPNAARFTEDMGEDA